MARYVKTEQGYQEIEAINSKFSPFKPAGKSYLTFRSLSSFTLKVNDTTKHWNGTLEYFASDKTWAVWDGITTLSAVADDGEYVLYLRGTGNTIITGSSENYRWVLTGTDIKCIGNIENLLDYATVASGEHPTMASYCYAYMFSGCTSLTQAPALPATTLEEGCYCNMFYGCTSLTQAPSLPANTLKTNCYSQMFFGCSSLTQAPVLPATILAPYCCQLMFYGCSSLTQAPDLPATTLANYCYESMFDGCTSLAKAPALPAMILSDWCYHNMFRGCTSLTQAPVLPATTLANYCYESMFDGCTSLAKAPALPAKTIKAGCYSQMFFGCESLTQIPELPITKLESWCYAKMFYGCRGVKFSSTQTGEYTQEYFVGYLQDSVNLMFYNTGGTFTGTPNKDFYYLSSDNMIVRETEIDTLNGYVGSMIDVAIDKYADTAEYIIPSSTQGSIKKFKITVDDTGTLSATEVV